MIRTLSLLPLALTSLAACNSQVDPSFTGENLASVSGEAAGELLNPAETVEVGLLWLNTSGDDISVLGPTVEMTDGSFQLEIFELPPPQALDDLGNGDGDGFDRGESRVGIAFILALSPETEDDSSDAESRALGVAEDHVIVYVENDILPGTYGEEFLGGPLSAGFHILDVEPGDEGGDTIEFDAFTPSPADLETVVQIQMTPDARWPNWT